MLLRCDATDDREMKDVLRSTLAVIFMGCPHRDSQVACLGDAVKSMAGAVLGIRAEDEVLQDLSGASSMMLNLGRLAFIRLWNNFNFKVKTFQEQQPLPSEREVKEACTIRNEASAFGDPREHAEALAASHIDICKFQSAKDEGYRSLLFTILQVVGDESNRLRQLTDREQECLKMLAPQQPISETLLADSYPGTCLWLYDMPEFRAWHQRIDGWATKLLWIKGRPGSGKSVLLRSLRDRLEKQWGRAGCSFIWAAADGESLDGVFFPGSVQRQREACPATVYRSLLAQLFKQDPRLRKAILTLVKKNLIEGPPYLTDEQVVLLFADDYVDQKIESLARRTFIFVDASDACGVPYLTELLQQLSQLALNSDFSICVTSGAHEEVQVDNSIQVIMHQRNVDDILRFISLNLVSEWEDRNSTVVQIGDKAAGCFLWAKMVVNILNAAIHEGASQELVEDILIEMPDDLGMLYEWLFETLGPDEKIETLALMRWVMLAPEAMRLNDLRLAVRLSLQRPVGGPQISRIFELQTQSFPLGDAAAFDSAPRFLEWVRSRSIGLLELQEESVKGATDAIGDRRVHVVHESVRAFFLTGRGFACLTEPWSPNFYLTQDHIDEGHYTLLHTCLVYLGSSDFEPLKPFNLLAGPIGADGRRQARELTLTDREVIMSSWPFLQYAVDNLIFHMLSPRYFRYHLPQLEILHLFSANGCRLWRRWTALLGCSASEPDKVLQLCTEGSAGELLDPAFGAHYRLQRVCRKLGKLVTIESRPVPIQTAIRVDLGWPLRQTSAETYPARPQTGAFVHRKKLPRTIR